MPSARSTPNEVLRDLPSIDEVLRTAAGRRISVEAGEVHTTDMARIVVNNLRAELQAGDKAAADLLGLCEDRLEQAWRVEVRTGTHRVINATGVVIHTNLGRAPLSESAREAIGNEASQYCTLEYDLTTGKRGKRGLRAERMLAGLTGAESVLIVNNCAAAAFFVLTVFASGGEVVISRGELVEIGGDFRVPDVLSQSGAALREVGTTNRTKLADYEKAINDKTRLILRVHPSNYRIVGYTAMPSLAELSSLAHRHGLMLYEDIGSGALIDLSPVGLRDEPIAGLSLIAGADIITFSGDKLLGGPQAGIIAGKADRIDRLRKHPLYRALRIDKIAYAALEATLDSYRRGKAVLEIPVLTMLALTKEQITDRLERFSVQLTKGLEDNEDLSFDMIDGVSAIGGGAAPSVSLATRLLALSHKKLTVREMEEKLRQSNPPVIARILDGKLLIDLRTVADEDEPGLLTALLSLA
ncbi:MAG: L-seryl-tRNA(Sec) selenium transferase [Pyrinomonadaceae bacterium]